MPQRDSIPEQLKRLRLRSGLSMAKLAVALQLRGASSYQRYEDAALFKKGELPLRLVRRLVDTLVGLGSPPITREDVMRLAGLTDLSMPQMTTLDKTRWIWCVGEVAGGVWRESFEWAEDEWIPVAFAVHDERFPDALRRAVRVVGDSMDLLYPDGSILAFIELSEIGARPKVGDRVIVLRHRHDLTEATVKEYTKDSKGRPWLLPRSTNPAHTAMALDARDEGETINVFGLVVGCQRIE